ncbi:4670_t:CDS:2, partial [Diversispora eburnea]
MSWTHVRFRNQLISKAEELDKIIITFVSEVYTNLTVSDSKPEVTSVRTTPNLFAKLSSSKLESSRPVRTVRPVSNVQITKQRKGPTSMRLPDVGNTTRTPFANFSQFVDPSGKLNFSGKAVLHAQGVDFSNGTSYKINMNDLRLEGELGKGQFGTVQKVFHKPTNVIMAMKVKAKLNQILMELDILHQSKSEFIVEFYGAFFTESCVYYCMEYMDAGSLDKLYNKGVPEDVLAIIIIA